MGFCGDGHSFGVRLRLGPALVSLDFSFPRRPEALARFGASLPAVPFWPVQVSVPMGPIWVASMDLLRFCRASFATLAAYLSVSDGRAVAPTR